METYTSATPIFEPRGAISEANAQWHAVVTRSNFEKRVAIDLESRHVDAFLQLVRETHQWMDRRKAVDVPVFPVYLFVNMKDREQNRLAALRTNGTVRIL